MAAIAAAAASAFPGFPSQPVHPTDAEVYLYLQLQLYMYLYLRWPGRIRDFFPTICVTRRDMCKRLGALREKSF